MSSDSDYVIAGTVADRIVARLVYLQTLPVVGRAIWLLLRLRGTDIPPRALNEVGPLLLPHAGIGVVVHPNVRLGRRVALFQGVTIGRSDVWRPIDGQPLCHVADDVIIGAGAAVLFSSGGLSIGEGAVIGANSVVTHDVPAGEIWAGSPAHKVGSR